MMKALKKNWFWLLLAVVVAGALWYWWQNKPKTSESEDDKAKTPSPNPNNAATTTPSATTDYIASNCEGGLAGIKKKFFTDNQWNNQPLSMEYRGKNKCQTALLQKFLNHYEKAGLAVDGDFGPRTEAAVLKTFGKKQSNLTEAAIKYGYYKKQSDGSFSMVPMESSPWPW